MTASAKLTDANDLMQVGGPAAVKRLVDGAVLANKAKFDRREVGRLLTVPAASVIPELIRWFWKSRIALGKLTLIAGDPGLGKSMLMASLAAHCSTGRAWPTGEPCPCGDVLFVSAEDDPADTIRPRLDAAGADPSRVFIVLGIEVFDAKGIGARRPMNLRDIEAIRTAALELPACRLIVIDPVSAYLGGLDGHNNAEVRALLVPLSDLARDVGAAVVCVTHLNKGSGGQALYRATGSLAFVAAARAAWAVARDKTDPDRRLFLPMKNNIGKDTSGLAYRIAETNGVPHVVWEGEAVDIDVDDALNGGGEIDYEASARGEAEDWLCDQLSAGALSAKEITSAAREVGIARRTLDRAKGALGIRSRKVGGKGNKDGKWIWELPESESGNQGAIDFGIEGDGK